MTSLHQHFLEVNSFRYEWTVNRFSSLGQPNVNRRTGLTTESYVESPQFPTDPANGNIPLWSVRAYAREKSEKEYLGLEIMLRSHHNACAKFKISILNNKREQLTVVYANTSIFTPGTGQRFRQVISRDILMMEANGLLPQDKLTLLCEISVVLESVKASIEPSIVQIQDPKHKLSENFGILFDSKQCSDVTLATPGREFKAHSVVLIARSKVFAAMFEHEMEEKKLNRVTITDIDPNVLEEMLRYMYTDKVSNLDTMADHLLAAADKYALVNLKVMCEESLRTNITIENAANTLVLADRYNAEQLKRRTIDFIITNASGVVGTPGWTDLLTCHAHLIAEAFCAIAIGPNYKQVKD